jgi:hypothetical protein
MKKALVLLLILAVVGVTAFAEAKVSVGGWGRLGYVFAQGSNSVTVPIANSFPGWGATGGHVGIGINGSSDNVGFTLNINADGSNTTIGAASYDDNGVLSTDNTTFTIPTVNVGDQAKIWIKFMDMITLQIGKVQGDTLRGKIGDNGSGGAFGVSSFGNQDDIFQRFYPKAGLLLDINPVEGLYIGAALDAGAQDDAGVATTAAAIGAIQIGAGYTIKDIGMIRAQYIGSGNKTTAKYFQAAFAFTGVPGLTADLGAKVQINADLKEKTHILLGVGYGIDALSLTARVKADLGESSTGNTDTDLGVYLEAAYAVASPVTVGLQASLDLPKDANTLALMPYLKFGYSNGFVSAGFAYKTGLSTGNNTSNSWAIPVFAEYWF